MIGKIFLKEISRIQRNNNSLQIGTKGIKMTEILKTAALKVPTSSSFAIWTAPPQVPVNASRCTPQRRNCFLEILLTKVNYLIKSMARTAVGSCWRLWGMVWAKLFMKAISWILANHRICCRIPAKPCRFGRVSRGRRGRGVPSLRWDRVRFVK